jgi:hypothetical protein
MLIRDSSVFDPIKKKKRDSSAYHFPNERPQQLGDLVMYGIEGHDLSYIPTMESMHMHSWNKYMFHHSISRIKYKNDVLTLASMERGVVRVVPLLYLAPLPDHHGASWAPFLGIRLLMSLSLN